MKKMMHVLIVQLNYLILHNKKSASTHINILFIILIMIFIRLIYDYIYLNFFVHYYKTILNYFIK
jgi:hypothetical protein